MYHFLYFSVWSLDRWGQRHSWRRHTALPEISFRSCRSEQYEDSRLVGIDRERVHNIAWQEDHCPWCSLDRPTASRKGHLALQHIESFVFPMVNVRRRNVAFSAG